jgi:hypothetical protein
MDPHWERIAIPQPHRPRQLQGHVRLHQELARMIMQFALPVGVRETQPCQHGSFVGMTTVG